MSAEDEKTKCFAFHIRFSDQLAFASTARRCCQRQGSLSLSACLLALPRVRRGPGGGKK